MAHGCHAALVSFQEVKSRREAIQAIFKETAESQIKELQERYKKALADFAVPESSPDYENFLLEKAALEMLMKLTHGRQQACSSRSRIERGRPHTKKT
jgi:hypothetical protein